MLSALNRVQNQAAVQVPIITCRVVHTCKHTKIISYTYMHMCIQAHMVISIMTTMSSVHLVTGCATNQYSWKLHQDIHIWLCQDTIEYWFAFWWPLWIILMFILLAEFDDFWFVLMWPDVSQALLIIFFSDKIQRVITFSQDSGFRSHVPW